MDLIVLHKVKSPLTGSNDADPNLSLELMVFSEI